MKVPTLAVVEADVALDAHLPVRRLQLRRRCRVDMPRSFAALDRSSTSRASSAFLDMGVPPRMVAGRVSAARCRLGAAGDAAARASRRMSRIRRGRARAARRARCRRRQIALSAGAEPRVTAIGPDAHQCRGARSRTAGAATSRPRRRSVASPAPRLRRERAPPLVERRASGAVLDQHRARGPRPRLVEREVARLGQRDVHARIEHSVDRLDRSAPAPRRAPRRNARAPRSRSGPARPRRTPPRAPAPRASGASPRAATESARGTSSGETSNAVASRSRRAPSSRSLLAPIPCCVERDDDVVRLSLSSSPAATVAPATAGTTALGEPRCAWSRSDRKTPRESASPAPATAWLSRR